MADDPYNPSPIGNPSVLARRNWWQTRLVIWIGKLTPKCPEVTRLLSRSMEEPLPWRTRFLIRLHYLICAWCQRYGKQLKFMRALAREYEHHCMETCTDRLSDAARDRLKRVLEAELNKTEG